MKLGITVTTIAFLGLATLSLAESESRTKMVVAVVADDSGEETRIELDSDELGFDLHDMQQGENRSIVDKNGQTILVTREADGFRFDVNGKTIRMPAFHGDRHGEHHEMIEIDGADADDVDVRVIRSGHPGHTHGPEDIMIMSGKPIDDATRHAINSLLESAGHTSDVRFIDHEAPNGGPHRIKVIEKRVEVAE